MIRTHTDSGRRKTKDEMISSYYRQYMYRCRCSHTQLIPNQLDRVICSHCGNYVYRNKKLEFKDKLLKKIKEKEYV